jgi:allantoinase
MRYLVTRTSLQLGAPDGAAALRPVLERLKTVDEVWLTDTAAILKAAGAN